MKRSVLFVFAILMVVAACAPQVAQQPSQPGPSAMPSPAIAVGGLTESIIVRAGSLEWKPAPASLPSGAEIMVLEGNLSKAEAFTFRLKVPEGYVIAPHTHPAVEHVTVLSGALRFGEGETIDEESATVLAGGSFAAFPANHAMYAIALEDSVFQVHGVGPWGITYVNPADDPRKK